MTVGSTETELIIELLRDVHGSNFSEYSRPSFTRRLQRIVDTDCKGDLGLLVRELTNNKGYYLRFLDELTVNVTELFREPDFFVAFRKKVIPRLRNASEIRIWHAACSTGEEVHSMAILLKKEGLLEKSKLIGTDLNPKAIEIARNGAYPEELLVQYGRNYHLACGSGRLSDHYDMSKGQFRLREDLKAHVEFSVHDLVLDARFGTFDVVVCRNALIYFQKTLQSKVIRVFKNSLTDDGHLCLGASENLLFAEDRFSFDMIDIEHKIYRKRVV